MQTTLLEQQAKVDELNAQLAAEKALPQQLSEQSALIDQLHDAIPVLEQRVSEQHAQIQLLETQVEEGKEHEARVHRRDADISALVEELDKQRATAEGQTQLIDSLRETIADLEDLKEAVAARDATIEDLRQQVIADGEEHKQQVAAHERTVTDLQGELSPLRGRVEEQLSRISELSVEADSAKTHEARVAEQAKLIADLQAMLSQDKMLETKVNEQNILMTELRGAVSAGEIELGHQREHAALLQRELSDSEMEKTALREKAEKLAADLEAARSQMKEIETKPRNTPPPPPRRQSSTLPWYMLVQSSFSVASLRDETNAPSFTQEPIFVIAGLKFVWLKFNRHYDHCTMSYYFYVASRRAKVCTDVSQMLYCLSIIHVSDSRKTLLPD